MSLAKNSEPRTQIISEESCRGRRSQPAELRRLRKQVTEAKVGPLEFREEKGKGDMPGGKKRGEGKAQVCSPEGKCSLGALS